MKTYRARILFVEDEYDPEEEEEIGYILVNGSEVDISNIRYYQLEVEEVIPHVFRKMVNGKKEIHFKDQDEDTFIFILEE